MLARASSDAGTRLRRSKSTTTVHRHQPSAPGPVDPDAAQRQALAAASTAFVRAYELEATERTKKCSSKVSRSKSNVSRKSLTSQGSHFPPREASLRSLHPQRNAQIPAAQRQARAPTVATEKFPPFYPTPGNERPLSTQPSITFNENVRPNTQPKAHRASASSSVTSQQIRKARSMYYASSVQTGSPIARPPAKYLTTPPATSVSSGPDKSPALLQIRSTVPSPLASPRLPVIVEPDETVDNARDKYLQSFHQRPVKHKPSLFLAPFKKRQDKEKGKKKDRKDRATSAAVASRSSHHRQTPNDPTLDLTLSDFQPSKEKEKKEKRSFSGSIKEKFKRVFRRTSNNATTLPVQQIEASRDYFSCRATHAEHQHIVDRSYEIPSPDEETLRRIRSRTPSHEAMPVTQARPVSQGSNRSSRSNRSLHSETNATLTSGSRVTSWGDSSAGNTLTQREIKRLTVIHEAKDSFGSDAERSIAASSPRRKSFPLPSLAAFRDPMPMESLVEEALTPVDPKRVFSALMKEMDGSKTTQLRTGPSSPSPGEESDVFLSSAIKDLQSTAAKELDASASRDCRVSVSSDRRLPSRRRPESSASHTKANSIKSFGKALKSTIRAVTPTEPFLPDRATSVRGVVRIPRPDTAGSSSTISEEDGEEPTVGSINFKMSARGSRAPTHDSKVSILVTPTAQQIGHRIQKSRDRWKTPLEEAHTPDVPRTDHRSSSVYHSAVQNVTPPCPHGTVAIPALAELEGDSPTDATSDNADQSPVSPPPRSPIPRPVFSPLSPSIYSRNTDGVSILPNDSVMSFDGANDNAAHEGGSAVIVPSQAVKSYVIGTPTPKRGTDSTRSSRDWKAWLSHEVSELENSLQEITIHERYTPRCGHQRELTEIEDGDDTATVGIRESSDAATPRQETRPTATPMEAPQGAPEVPTPVGEDRKLSPEPRGAQRIAETPVQLPKSTPSSASIPIARRSQVLSVTSARSSLSQPKSDTPKSERMIDRFPYIITNRRSSTNSAKLSRSSRQSGTPTESGSSSVNSKATPSPKVYSDLSAPGADSSKPGRRKSRMPTVSSLNSKETPSSNVYSDISAPVRNASKTARNSTRADAFHNDSDKENRKENIAEAPHGRLAQGMESPALNRSPSTLAQYTTSAEDIKNTKVGLARTSTPSRTRLRPQSQLGPVSPRKLTARPKSAFDLRGTNIPSSKPPLRKSVENETLRMLLDTPWAASGAPPSPRTSLEQAREKARIKLHVKHSSSTLALNKEPSPGTEQNTIDVLIEERAMMAAARERAESRGGSTTPGQRMAERFLRERHAGSGAGSPVSDVNEGDGTEQREDTPAFI